MEYLTEHYHEAPVWIVACQDDGEETPTRSSGASIYPAVQNMLLAARALGLGATLTSRHLRHEKEVEEILGPAARCPFLRHPAHRLPHGQLRAGASRAAGRRVYQDRWGEPYIAD